MKKLYVNKISVIFVVVVVVFRLSESENIHEKTTVDRYKLRVRVYSENSHILPSCQ